MSKAIINDRNRTLSASNLLIDPQKKAPEKQWLVEPLTKEDGMHASVDVKLEGPY